MAEAVAASPRNRGVRYLVVAAILLVVLLIVLALLQPDLGTYPGWGFPIVHGLWLAATSHFGVGSFLAIVGGPEDRWFRAMRTVIGVLIGITMTVSFALGAWLLQVAMAHERTAADGVEYSSWDDD